MNCADLHAVAPALPAEPPGAERRAFPIVLDEADVVQQRVEADRRQRAEIELLQVRRVGLQDHLVLVIVLQPVRVLAVAAVLGAARRLHVGGVPAAGAERAQRGRRMEGAGADLHVVGLQDQAALVGPVIVQRQDQPLEGAVRTHVIGGLGRTRWASAGLQLMAPRRMRLRTEIEFFAATSLGQALRLRSGPSRWYIG